MVLNAIDFEYKERMNDKGSGSWSLNYDSEYASDVWLYDYRKLKITKQIEGVEKLVCYGVVIGMELDLFSVSVKFGDLMDFLDVQTIDVDKNYVGDGLDVIVNELFDDMNLVDDSMLTVDCSDVDVLNIDFDA